MVPVVGGFVYYLRNSILTNLNRISAKKVDFLLKVKGPLYNPNHTLRMRSYLILGKLYEGTLESSVITPSVHHRIAPSTCELSQSLHFKLIKSNREETSGLKILA